MSRGYEVPSDCCLSVTWANPDRLVLLWCQSIEFNNILDTALAVQVVIH